MHPGGHETPGAKRAHWRAAVPYNRRRALDLNAISILGEPQPLRARSSCPLTQCHVRVKPRRSAQDRLKRTVEGAEGGTRVAREDRKGTLGRGWRGEKPGRRQWGAEPHSATTSGRERKLPLRQVPCSSARRKDSIAAGIVKRECY